jgi:hypothetical protein
MIPGNLACTAYMQEPMSIKASEEAYMPRSLPLRESIVLSVTMLSSDPAAIEMDHQV